MPSPQSLTERVRSIPLGGHVLAAGFFGQTPVFATAEGAVRLGLDDGVDVAVHGGGMLAAIVERDAVLSGGEDGRIMRTSLRGDVAALGEEKGKWIDALASGPDGAAAWSAGKMVAAPSGKGDTKRLEAPSTARGLAFMPKGYRLAMSHYNGATLWFPNASAAPETLVWKGSHLDVTASPDGRHVVTSMQENALHGWRVEDKAHMRMTGYPAKTRSMSWSHDGNWLATSGAEAAIIWPFSGKDGPMGKAPRECGVRPVRVSRVAFHPGALVLAIGYDDGCVLLVRLTDASELMARAPAADKGAGSACAVSALAWDREGRRLAMGGADGYAGVLTLP
jgi:WD40 repeat protein